MTWLNPWALFGLAALSVPVLVHLLSRREARTQKFPTLRFIRASPLLTTRRTRLTDRLLLAIRLGIIAAAVLALAQPLLRDSNQREPLDEALAGVFIIDSSTSMRRSETSPAAPGRPVDSTTVVYTRSRMIQTFAPGRAIQGAAAWLATQPGRRELLIYSDFQIGDVDSVDLASVPADIGITLRQVGQNAPGPEREVSTLRAGLSVTARITPELDRTAVDWSARRVERGGDGALLVLTSDDERPAAQAARRAASAVAAFPEDSGRAVALVFPGYPRRGELIGIASLPDEAWMGEVLVRVGADAVLAQAASSAVPTDSTSGSAFTVVARNKAGSPVVVAARANVEGRDRLVFFPLVDPGSLASAALMVSLAQVLTPVEDIASFEPSRLSAETLKGWERPPGAAASYEPSAKQGPSDGRWVWVAVLVLLAVEGLVRRRVQAGRREETLAPVA